MCTTCNNDETPRTCSSCNEPEFAWGNVGLNAQGLCPECVSEGVAVPPTRYDASERHLSPAWQEEQYSARYEDRYGPGYDPYED